MKKRVIILAGGLGTRLKPYTISLPKPLVPIGTKPIMEIIIEQLSRHGFDHITLAVNHQADLIKAYFQDGSKYGLRIDYALETKPLGTMGPLSNIQDLPENFLVMNGDVLTDIDYASFYNEHVAKGSIFSISSYVRESMIDFGVLEVTEERYLSKISEKPKMKFEVSMGIYMLKKSVLQYIPKNEFYNFDTLMEQLISREEYPRVVPHSGYWLDIGRPSDYEMANEDFLKIIR
jgi:NDP-sugar pyrophosphorylase family protein